MSRFLSLVSFAVLACVLAVASGCGGAVNPDAEAAPLTAEQLAEAAREEAQVQDAEREQQKLVQRKPARK